MALIAALQVANVQGEDNARTRAEDIADGILLVMDDIVRQTERAIFYVNSDITPSERCGQKHQEALYRAASSLSYIEAVGLISHDGSHLQCSTFGPVGDEIKFGDVDYTTPDGYVFYKHATSKFLFDNDYTLITKGDAAIFINNTTANGILSHRSDISLGAYRKDGGPVMFGRGTVDPRTSEKYVGESSSYVDAHHLVAVSYSTSSSYVAFVAFPVARVARSVARSTRLILPIAFIIGFTIAVILYFGLRRATSLSFALRRALPTKNIFMNYQPMIDMTTGECVGAEALMRWNDNGKLVSPDRFIEAAENAGIMGLVTRRVASLVAWDIADHLRKNPGFHISINLSAADLSSKSTIQLLSGFLSLTGIPAACLWVEITETGVLDATTGAEAVRLFKAMGLKVAVDDFGTGYASLSMLGDLKVDIMKIDKKFISTIITGDDGEEGSEIVCAIINLANSLKLDIVAEGVETEAQAAFLMAHGVRYGQGWLFGKPKSMSELEYFCESNARKSKA
ncbi:EAL domain-containing protein [Xylophilus sp. Kf1]|nr:EAL domain-containing protein [Xylophilus sp. Kf1]